MRPPPRSALSAIILAGGQGSRMRGRDKARLRRGHSNLVEHLVRQLQPVAAEIIVVRRRARARIKLPQGCQHAWDHGGYAGPVAGLEAGLRRARRHWCLCVPVDGLNPPQNMLRKLSRGRGGGYVQHESDAYYLHCLVPRRGRRTLHEFLDGGGRSAANACRQMGLAPRPIGASRSTVWSINTTGEWRRLQRHAP